MVAGRGGGFLYLVAGSWDGDGVCGGALGSGQVDVGTVDVGLVDVGTVNGGTLDVGTVDGGTLDVGRGDGGTWDAALGWKTALHVLVEERLCSGTVGPTCVGLQVAGGRGQDTGVPPIGVWGWLGGTKSSPPAGLGVVDGPGGFRLQAGVV
jgi:hypothetical protein